MFCLEVAIGWYGHGWLVVTTLSQVVASGQRRRVILDFPDHLALFYLMLLITRRGRRPAPFRRRGIGNLARPNNEGMRVSGAQKEGDCKNVLRLRESESASASVIHPQPHLKAASNAEINTKRSQTARSTIVDVVSGWLLLMAGGRGKESRDAHAFIGVDSMYECVAGGCRRLRSVTLTLSRGDARGPRAGSTVPAVELEET